MALKLKRNGEASHLQDHNLLKNLEKENQHPIKSIIGLRSELDSKASSVDVETAFNKVSGDLDVVTSDLKGIDVRVTEIERKINDGEIGGPGGGVGKDEIVKIINETVNPKFNSVRSKLKDLHIQNIKAYIKYDKALGLSANTCGDYYTDATAGSLKKEGEK